MSDEEAPPKQEEKSSKEEEEGSRGRETEGRRDSRDESRRSGGDSRGGSSRGTEDRIGGIDDQSMDELLDKLKALGYYKFLTNKTFKPIHKVYFILPSNNPADQFYYFASLCSWLMELSGHSWSPPSQFDDPNTTAGNIVNELKDMNFNIRHIAPGRLRQGHGDAVLHVLDILTDKAMVTTAHSWGTPEWAPDVYAEQDELEAIGDGPDEGEIEDMIDIEDDEAEEEWFHTKKDDGDDDREEAIESQVDAEAWRMEVERVLPLLKAQRRQHTNKDWRSHVDWISSLIKTINKTFPDVRSSLEGITDDVMKALEKIQKREQSLTTQFENWVEKYRLNKKDFTAVQETMKENQEKVSALSNELNHLNEAVDTMKAEIQQREEAMTDTTPLVKVKEAMTKVKLEIKEMDLRIGVLQHHVLHYRIKESQSQPAQPAQTSL